MGAETAAIVAAYASIAASIGGAAYSAYASNQAAKQSEMNAQAQADALRMEQVRKSQEMEINMKRKAQDDKRFRATQLAEMSGMGISPTVGTPLDIMAETAIAQERDLQDMVYDGDLTSRELEYGAQSALAVGRQQASNYRMQAGATILSGIGQVAGSYSSMSRPKTATAPQRY